MTTIKILVNNIIASLDAGEDDIFLAAKKKITKASLKLAPLSFTVYKKSIDARKKSDIKLVYSVVAECECAQSFELTDLTEHSFSRLDEDPLEISYGSESLDKRPIVVGMGPAGMFCALLLAEHGYKPLVIERGDDIDTRIAKKELFYSSHTLDTESNIQFGAGGAGTFSDGKLVTRVNDSLCSYVLRRMNELGAPKEILIKAKPHVGTDNLRALVKNIDMRIRELGGDILYRTRLDDISFDSFGNVCSILVNKNTQISCSCLILCVGHSARDTYEMLMKKDMSITPKPFSVGVRIEHLKEDIDRALYGKFASHKALGAAEYNLSYNTKARGVYTFCMCPGGEVVAAASEENTVVVNGMSNYARNGKNSNCAIAVSVFESDYGSKTQNAIDFQRELESLAYNVGGGRYAAPITRLDAFFDKKTSAAPTKVKPTYMNGDNCKLSNFSSFMPTFMYESLCDGIAAFDKKIHGFASPNAILSAFETRTSAPIRILRCENRTALGHGNLYPCGEGAGYAGGITSAAIDGLKCAIEIMGRYAQPK